MEKISYILLTLTILATFTKGEDVIEESVADESDEQKVGDLGGLLGLAKPPGHLISIHSPSHHVGPPPPHPPVSHASPHPPNHPPSLPPSHPPSHPSHPPPPPPPPPPPSCKTFPACNALNSSCCNCKNDLRKCCADGSSSTKEGYCLRDSCLSCVDLGKDCWHNNQCCSGSAATPTCTNRVCCLGLGKTKCTKDADCCQPVPADPIWGTTCSTSTGGGTCISCKADGQACATATDCCGGRICGNTVGASFDYDKIGICCLPPNSPCTVGLSACCGYLNCPLSSSNIYFCKPNPVVSATKEIDDDKSGWGSSGGWNSNGWGNNDNGNGLPPGLSSGGGYPQGICTKCAEYSSCKYDTDCCEGFTCSSTQCRSILDVKLNIQRLANDDNLQQLDS